MSNTTEETGLTTRTSVQGAETASAAVAAQAKAMIESRYLMAMKNPRNMDQVRQDLLKECRRPSFARNKSALYRKPIGKGVEGLGIRFVEVALRCMRNVLAESMMVYADSEREIHRVIVTDLENNNTWPMDIAVSKTVERSKPQDDGSYISVRKNSFNKNVYTVPATDDDLLNKRLALISKALRTAGLRIIPGDLQDEAEEIIRTIRLDDAAKDPDAERHRLADAFASIGVKASDLRDYLEHPLDSCTPAELVDLRGLYGALKDGEATWVDVMENKRASDDKPSLGEVARKSDAQQSAASDAFVAGAMAASDEPPKTATLPIDVTKPHHVEDVTAASKKGGPFTVTLRGGAKLTCKDQRLYISAASAKQSGAAVIVDARMDGETLILAGLEEIEG